ncbi:MAG TPA: hypothetical protein VN706_05320 [Gemmatimonadaceae bacterium]|nr:hypothetical protein [Gemmatimonadaceae bacterium]
MRRTVAKVPAVVPSFLRPGSDQARRVGCMCSMIANYYGCGFGDPNHPLFEISKECVLHRSLAGSGGEAVHV